MLGDRSPQQWQQEAFGDIDAWLRALGLRRWSTMTQPTFNIFDALSAWGKTLPTWQHFLLSKLVENVELPEIVRHEVYLEYLIDQNLAGPCAARVAWDLTLPQFQPGAPAAVSTLTTMTGVSGVNALAAGETLSFGPKLTVIYGPNGAGKSGYARVLKSACFTRSKDVGILGDVKLVESKQPKPTAKFFFDDGSSEDFVHQEPCQRMRDGFAVFDSTCVRVHLDGRNAFQVMPYLFDVFPRMVAVFIELQTKLRDQITLRMPAADKYAIQNSTSDVASALSVLTAQTDLTRLQELAVYGEAEAVRLSAIEQQLVELRTTDPKEIVKRNEQRIADLKTVHASIGALAQAIQPSLVQGIAEAVSRTTALVEQGAALSSARFGGEPVQPVGTRAWLDLLAAAIAYGDEAYPGAPFPPQTDGARCVLCQQTLDAASADRLTKFYQTATSGVEAQLAATRRTLKSHSVALGKIGLSFFGEESAARRIGTWGMPSSTKPSPATANPKRSYHSARCDWASSTHGPLVVSSTVCTSWAAMPPLRVETCVTTRPIRRASPSSSTRRYATAAPFRSIQRC